MSSILADQYHPRNISPNEANAGGGGRGTAVRSPKNFRDFNLLLSLLVLVYFCSFIASITVTEDKLH